ncbi:MAG: hypothetical protein ACRDHP_12365 [Ktedonobacterales bacterium]
MSEASSATTRDTRRDGWESRELGLVAERYRGVLEVSRAAA